MRDQSFTLFLMFLQKFLVVLGLLFLKYNVISLLIDLGRKSCSKYFASSSSDGTGSSLFFFNYLQFCIQCPGKQLRRSFLLKQEIINNLNLLIIATSTGWCISFYSKLYFYINESTYERFLYWQEYQNWKQKKRKLNYVS